MSAVVLGSFNPAIVQPAWLARHGLVRDAEAAEAKIDIIQNEFALYTVGPFKVFAQNDRFSVDVTESGVGATLRDFVVGVFQLLGETPVRQFGINRQMHFRSQSNEEWHAVGHALAPKEIYDGLLEEPGMQSLTVRGKRSGSDCDYVALTIQPSVKFEPGVYFATNAHYRVAGSGPDQMIELLMAEWEQTQLFSEKLAVEVLDRVVPS